MEAAAAAQAIEMEARGAAAECATQRVAEALALAEERAQGLEAMLVAMQAGARASEAEVETAIAAAVAGAEVAVAALRGELVEAEAAGGLVGSQAGASPGSRSLSG